MSKNVENCPLWIFRCNFQIGNPAYPVKKELYEKNLCPILILDEETWDQYCYDELIEKEKSKDSVQWEDYIKRLKNNELPQNVKNKNVPPYINAFFRLYQQSHESDIIVVLEYSGKMYTRKMGLIKKGTKAQLIQGKGYKIYAFPLSGIKEMVSKYDTIFSGLLPMNLTAAKLSHHVQGVKCVFYEKRPTEISLDVLSNSQIEELCFTWIKSQLPPERLQMTRPIVSSGKGNIPTIDILGLNQYKDIIAVQVSYTEEDKLILDKIGKLLDFEADIRVICVNPKDEEVLERKVEEKYKNDEKFGSLNIIPLSKVLNECINDKECKSKIDKMIDELYDFS